MLSRSIRAAAERSAALSRLLSNPTRVFIILLLHERGGAYVQKIADELEVSQSAVSHQLGLLAEEGIVSCKREGRDVFYTIAKKAHARKILRALRVLRT